MSCIQCGTTDSTRWYYNKSTCRSCHRAQVYYSKPENKTRLERKNNPCCLTCDKTDSKRWFKSHTQCQSCFNREYKQANAEKIKTQVKQKRISNPEYFASKKRKTRAKNPFQHRLEVKLRKKGVRQATPKWVNKSELVEFWKNAPNTMQVDHIIPINNPNVCGLNVVWNLQYLSPIENNKKNNLFDFTMNNESWKKWA